jgi:hypothetical protein
VCVLAAVNADNSGTFTVANLSAATDALVVSAAGYATTDPLHVSIPSDTGLVVALSPIPPVSDPPTDDTTAQANN